MDGLGGGIDSFRTRFHAAQADAVRLLNHWPRSDLDGATAVVAGCFAARGLSEPEGEARRIARMLIDPWWLYRHPIKAHREGWRIWGRFPSSEDR